MRELYVTPLCRKDLKGLPQHIREQANDILSFLIKDPLDARLHPKKLKGKYENTYRVRVGLYRLLYTFNAHQLILFRLRDRKDVYRSF
jgi:mRNA-degrading endonuclease RelE of RelBE toxin-antitoxin system